ncbi:MAG: S8 family serine peptidase [Burkholderiaceae bacterium]|nr:S8 family serine peptidase [Burkholderiaceae bacterium]
MSRWLRAMTGLLLMVGAASDIGLAAAEQTVRRLPKDAPTDRIIVKLRAGAAAPAAAEPRARIAALAARAGMRFELARSITDRLHSVQLERPLAGAEMRARLARLAADPDVEYAEPDRRQFPLAVPNDPLYSRTPQTGQWYLTNPDASFPAAIGAERAWDLTTGSASVVVAVLDTGVLFNHPDLGRVADGGNLLPGYDFVSGDFDAQGNLIGYLTANDGNGRDGDPSDPGDWLTQQEINQYPTVFPSNVCSPADSSWHGTHIAGIIAARTNNALGVAGIGWNVRVLPVRVLGKCAGYTSDILAAMRWAAGLSVPGVPTLPASQQARIINLSLGSPDACSQNYRETIDAVRARGVLVVAAAGNESGAVTEPANCPGVVAVTALRHVGTKVGFASFGPEVTIAAPGGNCVDTTGVTCLYPIISTDNSGRTSPQPGNGMIYGGKLGTSFSAPIVAGVAALMWSRNPTLTEAQLKERLRRTARAFPSDATLLSCSDPAFVRDGQGNYPNSGMCNCTTSTCGAGMVDAYRAVLAAANAVALVPQSVSGTAGQQIALDGSRSMPSPAGTTLSFRWSIVSGTGGTLSNSTQPIATFSAPAGTYVVQLEVTDNAPVATTDRANVTVTVNAPPPSGGGGGALPLAQLFALALLAFAARLRRR